MVEDYSRANDKDPPESGITAITVGNQRSQNLSKIVPLQDYQAEHTQNSRYRRADSQERSLSGSAQGSLSAKNEKARRKITFAEQISYDGNQEPILQNDQDQPQAEDESSGLTPEEMRKLEKIMSVLQGAVHEQEERDEIKEIIEDEWQDPTPDLVEGIFHVNQTNMFIRCCSKRRSEVKDKIVVYDCRSCYCLHFQNPVRQELVNFTCSTLFENFIIMLIFFNSIILAIYDYNDRDNLLAWNQLLERIGQVFTVLFALEMMLKILAQGFIIHNNAYLRDFESGAS